MANGAESQAASGGLQVYRQVTESVTNYGESALEALPTFALALVVFIAFWVAARVASGIVSRVAGEATDDESLTMLFGTIARVTVLVIGGFVAASVLFPGLKAGDLVAVLGLSSVAIGFAFKDIFQNFLAGILILLQRPFHINDQIIVTGYEGTVEDISIRATKLKTYSGERVIIPNSDIYSSAVTVRTAFDTRRTVFGTGIGYGEDVDEGREVILEALERCEHVLDDPAPQVYTASHGDSSVNFDVRYWTKSHSGQVAKAKSEVATKVKKALDDADIEIPYPYRTVEFYDMNEAA
jgi:small-conductance mechanosensitive channel